MLQKSKVLSLSVYLLSLIGLAPNSQAASPRMDRTGAYVGAAANYVFLQGSFTNTITPAGLLPETINNRQSAQMGIPSLQVGYSHQLTPRLMGGAEIEWMMGSIESKQVLQTQAGGIYGMQENRLKFRDTVALRPYLGFLYEDVCVQVGLQANYSLVKFEADWAAEAQRVSPLSTSKKRIGIGPMLGVRFPVSSHLEVGAMASWVLYARSFSLASGTQPDDSTATSKVSKSSLSTFGLNLIYRF